MMDCSLASQQIPLCWNGTLDDESARELEHHLEKCPKCRLDWSEAAAAWAIFAQHLTEGELLDIAEAGVRDEQAEHHLARCPECAEQLDFLAQGRASLEDESAKDGPAPGRSTPVPPMASRIAANRWRSLWPIAAGVLILVLSAGLLLTLSREQRTERLLGEATRQLKQAGDEGERLRDENLRSRDQLAQARTRLESIDRPLTNAAAVDLLPDEMRRRGGGQRAAVSVDVGEPLTLILTSVRRSRSENHRVVVSKDSGEEVWSDSTLKMNPSGDFTLAFPPSYFDPGLYLIKITPVTPPSWTQTYRLAVR